MSYVIMTDSYLCEKGIPKHATQLQHGKLFIITDIVITDAIVVVIVILIFY